MLIVAIAIFCGVASMLVIHTHVAQTPSVVHPVRYHYHAPVVTPEPDQVPAETPLELPDEEPAVKFLIPPVGPATVTTVGTGGIGVLA